MKTNKLVIKRFILTFFILCLSSHGFAFEQTLAPVINIVDMMKYTIVYCVLPLGVIAIIYQAYSVVFDGGSVQKLGYTFVFVAIAVCAAPIVQFIKMIAGG